jgi:hypothetical protein
LADHEWGLSPTSPFRRSLWEFPALRGPSLPACVLFADFAFLGELKEFAALGLTDYRLVGGHRFGSFA